MINIKKISIVALILLVVGITGSLLTFKPVIQSREISDEILINEAFTQIEILPNNTAVKVLPTSQSSAKLEVSGITGQNSTYHLSNDVQGSKLFIEVKNKQNSFISFFPSSLTITLYVPEKEYESLRIKGDNGLVQVDSLQVDDINVNISNGEIVLNNVDGKITGKTNNGSISLVTADLDRSISLDIDNGFIHILSEKEPTNATIEASVDLGKINIFGNSARNTVIGNGDNLIKLSTNNGNIKVEKK